MPSRRTLLAASLAASLAVPLAACVTTAPARDWTAYSPGSATRVDHRAWEVFLSRHAVPATDGQGDAVTLVDYARVPAADRELLDEYIAGLARTDPATLDRAEQLAYWINLHNALVVRLVLDHPIVSSPDEIEIGGLLDNGPWRTTLIEVVGRPVSIRGIVETALRPVFRDPRWHYALSEATIGGPTLRRDPYLGAEIDGQLEEAALDYVGSARAVSIVGEAQHLNDLWRRNMIDFGGNQAGVIANIQLYAPSDVRQELQPDRPTVWTDDRRLNELR